VLGLGFCVRVRVLGLPVNSTHGQLVTRSSRHTVNSSHARTFHKVNSSHSHIVTQSTRHKLTVWRVDSNDNQ